VCFDIIVLAQSNLIKLDWKLVPKKISLCTVYNFNYTTSKYIYLLNIFAI
jgi:hypothetical protein